MKAATLCLAAAMTVAISATPANAQAIEGVYEVADPDAPLSFLQRQALGEVREKDRSRFVYMARSIGIVIRSGPRLAKPTVKPLAEWTQGDLWAFRTEYDKFAEQRDDFENWSALELATMIRHLTLDGGGGGGD